MTETTAARAEALFVSPLQCSEAPSAEQVRAAVGEALARLGSRGCAAMVAQEYGENPTGAARRMLWALATMRVAFPDSDGPTFDTVDGWAPPSRLAA